MENTPVLNHDTDDTCCHGIFLAVLGSGIWSWISYGGARHANNQHAQAPQAYGLAPLIDTVWV